MARLGMARHVRRGPAWQARRDKIRRGWARIGEAGADWLGKAWYVAAWQAWQGQS